MAGTRTPTAAARALLAAFLGERWQASETAAQFRMRWCDEETIIEQTKEVGTTSYCMGQPLFGVGLILGF
jgi:hypothetical protein